MDQIATVQTTMSSLQIAELVGKEHKEVLRSIRAMEPAWENIAARKFALGSYLDANGQRRPCYQLTKTECLYIATKYNDEARARLILRWEELETQQAPQFPVPSTFREALLLAADLQQKIEEQQAQIDQLSQWPAIEEKKPYLEDLKMNDEPMNITTLAYDYGVSANELNTMLFAFGIHHREGNVWRLNPRFDGNGYVYIPEYNGHVSKKKPMRWTQKGRVFLYHVLKEHGILPTCEK